MFSKKSTLPEIGFRALKNFKLVFFEIFSCEQVNDLYVA
jgi:hypothetical protein